MKFSALCGAIASSMAVAPFVSASGATYFITNNNKGNYVVASNIGTDGKLSFGKAVWAGGRGSGHQATGFDALFSQGPVLARGSNVFAVNPGSNTITMFAKDAQDPTKLTMVSGPVSSQGEFPQSIAIHPTSGNICVLNGGAVNSVACFAPDPALGPVAIAGTYREIGIAQTTPPVGPGGTVTQVMFTVDGARLVASVKGVPPSPGFLAVWDVAANGSLSADYNAITAPSGGALPFGLSTLPHNPSVIVAADPAIGFDVLDLTGSLAMKANGSTAIQSNAAKNVMASGVSSATVVPNSSAVCWIAFSPHTGNFYLVDPGTNVITEVMVNSATYKPSMVKQYAPLANGSILDADVATVNGRDYLYVLAPNTTSIEVFSLPAVGSAQHIQSFNYADGLAAAGVDLTPMSVVGMSALA